MDESKLQETGTPPKMTAPDKMTLAELEKALKNPTPELIKELSRRAERAQGNCIHLETYNVNAAGFRVLAGDEEEYGPVAPYCGSCGTKNPSIPDVTRPENWGPMLVELLCGPGWRRGWAFYCSFSPEGLKVKELAIGAEDWYRDGQGRLQVRNDNLVHNPDPGVAVHLAFLKVKEGKK